VVFEPGLVPRRIRIEGQKDRESQFRSAWMNVVTAGNVDLHCHARIIHACRYPFLRSLKDTHAENAVPTLAGESALSKDWLTPEEDAAWANL
jgi:hypothetical protein